MSAGNPVCICTHLRSDHDDQPNPKCLELVWIPFGFRKNGYRVPCDCPGYEGDPKANGDNE